MWSVWIRGVWITWCGRYRNGTDRGSCGGPLQLMRGLLGSLQCSGFH